jgi:predicted amidohydrolase
MSLTVAAAQSSSIPGDVAGNVKRHLRFATAAAEQGVHLLVFPELSLTGYEPGLARDNAVAPEDVRLEPLRRQAQSSGMTIVAGAPVANSRQELHLAALVIAPDGSVSVHTKQYLHPGEEQVFTAGTGGAILHVSGANVALAICADIGHAEHPAAAAARGANVYAAGVLITEKGYEADAALLRQYARQHRMAALMANHAAPTGGWIPAGKSALWADRGELVAASVGREEALIIGTRQNGTWAGEVINCDFKF